MQKDWKDLSTDQKLDFLKESEEATRRVLTHFGRQLSELTMQVLVLEKRNMQTAKKIRTKGRAAD